MAKNELPYFDREQVAISSKTQCLSCSGPTGVDLKLSVGAPSKSPVAAPPAGDFLAVTWTAQETAALAKVFGAGKYSFTSGSDTNFTPLVLKGLSFPPDSHAHAYFFKATVNGNSVICLKSEFHPG
jgi:hypothetical protein